MRGGDVGHEWPSNLGGIRGVHTRSVAAVVAEIVAGAGKREDRVETAGGRWDELTQANARG